MIEGQPVGGFPRGHAGCEVEETVDGPAHACHVLQTGVAGGGADVRTQPVGPPLDAFFRLFDRIVDEGGVNAAFDTVVGIA